MTNGHLFYAKGRVALHALLKAIGVGTGSEVILQAFTCLAVPLPIVALGARPVYVDIDPQTYNLDVSQVAVRLTARTKAIIVQHTFGIPAPIAAIVDLARKHGLAVIEDCCHTLGTQVNGQTVGTFGDAAFYSYEWGKPVIVGTGGSAVGHRPDLAAKLVQAYADYVEPPTAAVLRIDVQRFVHGMLVTPALFWLVRDAFRFLSRAGVAAGTFDDEELAGNMPYFNRRLAAAHQRIALRKLSEVERDNGFRLGLARRYREALASIGVPQPQSRPDERVVYLRYPLAARDKERVLARARESRVELGDWFTSPVHPLSPAQWGRMGYEAGSCPVAEAVSRRIITLPIYRKMNEAAVARTLSFLAAMQSETSL